MALRAFLGLYGVSLVCSHQPIIPHMVALQAQLFFLRSQKPMPV
jgi:hypothetical protein